VQAENSSSTANADRSDLLRGLDPHYDDVDNALSLRPPSPHFRFESVESSRCGSTCHGYESDFHRAAHQATPGRRLTRHPARTDQRAIGRRARRIEGIALILAILLASTPNETRRERHVIEAMRPAHTATTADGSDRPHDLVDRIAAGDQAAFRCLYAFLAMRVWRDAIRVLPHPADARAVTRSTLSRCGT
jgi:hypothetical protein